MKTLNYISQLLFAACASATLLFVSSAAAQNVGIGVSNPQSKLTVNGTTASGGIAVGDSSYNIIENHACSVSIVLTTPMMRFGPPRQTPERAGRHQIPREGSRPFWLARALPFDRQPDLEHANSGTAGMAPKEPALIPDLDLARAMTCGLCWLRLLFRISQRDSADKPTFWNKEPCREPILTSMRMPFIVAFASLQRNAFCWRSLLSRAELIKFALQTRAGFIKARIQRFHCDRIFEWIPIRIVTVTTGQLPLLQLSLTRMKPILAKVTAIEKRGEQLVIVEISPKYRGSFSTLGFGEIKPHSGSLKDGRLDLVYHQSPGLNIGDPFPLWTLPLMQKEEEGNVSRLLAYQCNRSQE